MPILFASSRQSMAPRTAQLNDEVRDRNARFFGPPTVVDNFPALTSSVQRSNHAALCRRKANSVLRNGASVVPSQLNRRLLSSHCSEKQDRGITGTHLTDCRGL